MFSLGGSLVFGGIGSPLLRFPPSSESEESSSGAFSFMIFGDRVAPGAHQYRSALSGCTFLV
jgi:hypothetical protein